MRTLSLLALTLLLAACASDESPDDGVSTAGSLSEDAAEAEDDVSTAGSAAPASTVPMSGIDGDWVHCDGPTALDETVTIEGTVLRTTLDGRPAASMPFRIAMDELVLDDGRTYRGAVEGDVFRLTGDDGTAVYARPGTPCP